ncbi:hypothetical protein OTB20_34805 [Streptomyces sp. H27-H1]|uniref:hypothetical protein n=1 Tax=Streptomyces sp. H27-H1 TaxID=2996461 RepID=UPI00226EA745|nr:hypothetical protein [Streptomyces sp. H27-H1]MCY0931266.1 hypothetical protein [Streptomyces sp. H27-H1]
MYKSNGDVVCDCFGAGCAATGSIRYQVLVQVPEGKTAAPAYRLDALRIGTPGRTRPRVRQGPERELRVRATDRHAERAEDGDLRRAPDGDG